MKTLYIIAGSTLIILSIILSSGCSQARTNSTDVANTDNIYWTTTSQNVNAKIISVSKQLDYFNIYLKPKRFNKGSRQAELMLFDDKNLEPLTTNGKFARQWKQKMWHPF